MKTLILIVFILNTSLLIQAASRRKQNAETTLQHRVRWALLGAVAAARAFDWSSTQECLREPSEICHEVMLPDAAARSKPELALIEAGALGTEVLLSNHLARRHPKLTIVGDALSLSAVLATDVHNYDQCHGKRIQLKPPRLPRRPFPVEVTP